MKGPLSIPKPPPVMLFRRRACPHAARALELLAFTGAPLEVREIDDAPHSPEERASLLAAGLDDAALADAGRSIARVGAAGAARAAVLERPEQVLELFAIPLPPGETEGSFMRRVLQNRLA